MRQSAFEENFIEVAIIDDHALFRQSLKKALHYHGQIKVGIEASDYSELLDKLSISKVEIIIMDLCMPDLNRTKDTIRQIHQLLPQKRRKRISQYPYYRRLAGSHGVQLFMGKEVYR
ncbi:MAG TPA: response regulator [Puia sp.]|nr:response regulator [Puia sp.]